ncbi:MAG: hypothetical protein AAF501_08950 [Pseudomonadota bacterium]
MTSGLGKNVRSATGFLLAPDVFGRTAYPFSARPAESVRGREHAADAQTRILAATEAILGNQAGTDRTVAGDIVKGDTAREILPRETLQREILRRQILPSQGTG